MPTWTQADAEAIRVAILALAGGSRVVSVTFFGRTVTKLQTDMDALIKLLAVIDASLQTDSGTGYNYRLAATRSGF